MCLQYSFAQHPLDTIICFLVVRIARYSCGTFVAKNRYLAPYLAVTKCMLKKYLFLLLEKKHFLVIRRESWWLALQLASVWQHYALLKHTNGRLWIYAIGTTVSCMLQSVSTAQLNCGITKKLIHLQQASNNLIILFFQNLKNNFNKNGLEL